MTLALSARERYALFLQVNPQPIADRREQRRSNRLWEALQLDDVSEAVEEGKTQPKDWPADGPVHTVSLEADSREYLLELLERPIAATWISRLLSPIHDRLANPEGE